MFTFNWLSPLLNADGEIGAASQESNNSVEGTEIATVQGQGEQTSETSAEDVTKQESFAKRLKEQTEKALADERSKWEQETAKRSQEARDSYISEQGYTWQGVAITTEAEYKQALQEQELSEKLKARDLPEDVVNEMLESRRFREEAKTLRTKAEAEEKRKTDFAAFVEAFPGVDGKSIPQSVWDDVNKGRSLVDAYTKHDYQQLRSKLSSADSQSQAEQQLAELAAASTGSATGKGASTAPAFYTPDQVSKMSLEETNKNWTAIMESQKRWT